LKVNDSPSFIVTDDGIMLAIPIFAVGGVGFLIVI
jgi:hypothetical protein